MLVCAEVEHLLLFGVAGVSVDGGNGLHTAAPYALYVPERRGSLCYVK
jgi:hypothetical protein